MPIPKSPRVDCFSKSFSLRGFTEHAQLLVGDFPPPSGLRLEVVGVLVGVASSLTSRKPPSPFVVVCSVTNRPRPPEPPGKSPGARVGLGEMTGEGVLLRSCCCGGCCCLWVGSTTGSSRGVGLFFRLRTAGLLAPVRGGGVWCDQS